MKSLEDQDESHWKDCGNVQCAQVHATLDSLLQWLEVDCPESVYTVGKMVRVMDAIKARDQKPKPQPEGAKEFVEHWQKLDFEQLCLLAAQSLLRAADKVKEPK